jgi:hypothetical protein
MALSEQQLINWSKPISTSEDQKCKNALSQVSEVLRNKFGSKISIFLQGSYRNNTNVKLDSDVDIVIRYDNVFRYDIGSLSEEQIKVFHETYTNSEYTFGQFKNDCKQALDLTFGNQVERKNKCIQILGNTYRVNADVVPCFVMKRFRTPTGVTAEGISFDSDDGQRIDSFPEQHYKNGVAKTEATSRMYKRTVRILKNIKNKLIDAGSISENLASSFFIECLVWNVPDIYFDSSNYLNTLYNVIGRVCEDMKKEEKFREYAEVSDLYWLFRGGQRKPSDALLFMLKCLEYAKLK